MSDNELQKYKQLYSEYIDEIIELHNINQSFLNHIGLRTTFAVRRQIKKITKLHKNISKSSGLVYKENVLNNKKRQELRLRNREIAKKLHAEGKYKNDKRNKTTTDNI